MFWVCGRAQVEFKVTFMKGCVPVGRCGLAWIRSRTNPQTVSGYWEQNVEMLVWLDQNELRCP